MMHASMHYSLSWPLVEEVGFCNLHESDGSQQRSWWSYWSSWRRHSRPPRNLLHPGGLCLPCRTRPRGDGEIRSPEIEARRRQYVFTMPSPLALSKIFSIEIEHHRACAIMKENQWMGYLRDSKATSRAEKHLFLVGRFKYRDRDENC